MESSDPYSGLGAGQLRFGVILNAPSFNCWEAECVERLLESRMCRLEVVLLVHRPKEHFIPRLLRVVRYPLWAAYAVSSAYPQTSKLLKSNPFCDVETIHCAQEKMAILLDDEQVSRLTDYRLDFLLNFASAQADPRLAAIPRDGVWSYNYGDEQPAHSLPAALREVVQGAPVIRISLTRFNGDQQSGGYTVLRCGYFAIEPYSYPMTLDRARLASADFPVLACQDLICGRQKPPGSRNDTNQCKHVDVPGNRLMLRLILGSLRCRVLKRLRSAFTRLVWNAGFMDITELDPTKSHMVRKVRWLPSRRNSIAADPFVVRWRNQVILLTENVERGSNRGFIEAWSVKNGETRSLGKVIDGPVHLSYPSVTEWQGKIYCVPEQAQAHAIILYRAVDFPRSWEPVGAMLTNVEAIDPTLFRYGSFWWLAYTDASIDRYGRLMLWYSTGLLGPWMPHALNPVKIDPRSARGAGRPFSYGDHLVRPAQDCSGEYGARVVFNLITRLSPEEFQENVIGELKPNPNGPYPAGLHTICRDGDVAVVDGKAYVVDATALFRKCAARLRRSAGKSRQLV